VVADAMISAAKVCGPSSTVGDLRRLFADEHVHVALVVDDGALLAVVEPDDLLGARSEASPALALGLLRDRVVTPEQPLASTWAQMV
jgi:CBS-domain-containing membrane protein